MNTPQSQRTEMPTDTQIISQPPGPAMGDQPTFSLPAAAPQVNEGDVRLAKEAAAGKSTAGDSTALDSAAARPQSNSTDPRPPVLLDPIRWPSTAQLLHLLWEKPAAHIADDLGCSQASVLMRAKALHLPKPGHCYWQKKIAGIELEVPAEVKALMAKLDAEALQVKEVPPSDKARKRRPRVRRPPILWPPKALFLRRLWTEPSTHIACDLECSYHSVLARARTLGFPAPGNGYWQRKTAGIQADVPAEVEVLIASLTSPKMPDSPSLDDVPE